MELPYAVNSDWTPANLFNSSAVASTNVPSKYNPPACTLADPSSLAYTSSTFLLPRTTELLPLLIAPKPITVWFVASLPWKFLTLALEPITVFCLPAVRFLPLLLPRAVFCFPEDKFGKDL